MKEDEDFYAKITEFFCPEGQGEWTSLVIKGKKKKNSVCVCVCMSEREREVLSCLL